VDAVVPALSAPRDLDADANDGVAGGYRGITASVGILAGWRGVGLGGSAAGAGGRYGI